MVTDIQETTLSLPDPVLLELKERIKTLGSQTAVANDLSISPSMITEILKGRRTASPSILEKLGFVRITFHIKKDRILPVIRLIKMAMDEDVHLQQILDKVLAKK